MRAPSGRRRTAVSDVMTGDVLSVGPDAHFTEIATALFTGAVRAVPALDGDGRLLGVVSEADLLVTVEREERADGRRRWRPRHTRRSGPVAKVGAQTARELMTAPVVTVAPNTTLAKAARTVDGVLLETMLIDPAEVAVTVADGVVTTTGAPDTRMDAEPAVRFVQGIEGVVDVIDELSRRVDDRVAAPWAERLP